MSNTRRRLHRIVVVVVGICSLFVCASGANAQTAPKIEVVPQTGHSDWVTSVAFSPDTGRVASGSNDGTLKLWDLPTKRLLRTYVHRSTGEDSVTAVAISPDGTQLLSSGKSRSLKLWDVATGRLLRTFSGHDGAVTSVSFSPDGQLALSGGDDMRVKLWKVSDGEVVLSLEAHAGQVASVAFSPDGATFLSGGEDSKLKLWNAATGQLLRMFEGHEGGVLSVAFSPDGARLLSGSQDKTVRLWNATTGETLRSLRGHKDEVKAVAFSPDGERVLSGGGDTKSKKGDTALKLWNASTGELLPHFDENDQHQGLVWSVAFSKDGQFLLSGGYDRMLKLWNAAQGKRVWTYEGQADGLRSVAISRDGTRVATGAEDSTVRLWDAKTGSLLHALRGHSDWVFATVFSPDGTRLASAGRDGNVILWDARANPSTVAGRRLLTIEADKRETRSVAFSHDGRQLLSGGADGMVKLWDPATGRHLRTFSGQHSNGVWAVAFAPDDAIAVSGSYDGGLNVWDARSGQLIRSLKAHTWWVRSVAFSPDGNRLLSASEDGTVRLWNTATFEVIHDVGERGLAVRSVAFAPDATRFVTANADNTLKLWNARTGEHEVTLSGHLDGVRAVAYSPDGTRIVSGSYDATTRIWDARLDGPFAPQHDRLLATLIGGRNLDRWVAITPGGFFTASHRDAELLAVRRGLELTAVVQVADHLHRPDLVEQVLQGDPEHKYEGAAKLLNWQKIFDSGPAPQIDELPRRKTDRVGNTVRLAARIVDTGGGIAGRVVWRVNGVTQGDLSTPATTTRASYIVVEQTLPINPSKRNVIEVSAYNREGLLASLPLRFEVDDYVTTQPRPKMHILAMGVSKYAFNDWKLDYAAKDASTFAAALREVAKPIYDSGGSVRVLTDEEVTTQRIDAAFKALKSEVAAYDVFVLFVAGHGRTPPGLGTYYYLPQDLIFSPERSLRSHAIGQDQWQAWLAMIPAHKSILVFDTCESAAAAGLSRGGREREAALDRLRFATGRSIITAARQAAYEGYKEHGVLTYAILEGLSAREGGADEVDLLQLAAYIDLKVPAFSQELSGEAQRPHFKIEGNFPIGIRTAKMQRPGVVSVIPRAPTHALLRDEAVREKPARNAPKQRTIGRGTQVRVLEIVGDWAIVARDGQKLGHVPAKALLPLQ